jgi:hypothetical protein
MTHENVSRSYTGEENLTAFSALCKQYRTDLLWQVFEHLYQWKVRLRNVRKTALVSFLVCINNSIQFSFSSFILLRMTSLAIKQQQNSARVTTQLPCKQSNNLCLSKCNRSNEEQELSAGKFYIIILQLSNMYIVKSSDVHKHHYPHHTQLFHEAIKVNKICHRNLQQQQMVDIFKHKPGLW